MADPVTRSAAKLAALVAVPIALLAGLGAFLVLNAESSGDPPAAESTGPPATASAADTSPVSLAARDLTERERTVCRALLSQLPGTIRDLPQRPVTAGPEQNAAYGDPPITVECGVPGVEFAPTDELFVDESTCWYATEEQEATGWVTVDREVPVRVTVPAAYDGPGQWAGEFSRTIASTIRSAEEIPTGCSS